MMFEREGWEKGEWIWNVRRFCVWMLSLVVLYRCAGFRGVGVSDFMSILFLSFLEGGSSERNRRGEK